MPSSWNPGPGMICPSCSRSHFPFCGRENHAIGQTGFPPYAHGRGPPPLLITPTNHLQPMAGAFGHPFVQPPVPSWNSNVLEHLGPPGNLRHEGLLEQHQQPGLRVSHGSIHHGDLMSGPRFPPHGLDRFEHVAGGHMGSSGIDAGNIWLVEEERERERQREREREIWLAERQRKVLVQQIDRFGVQGQGAADRRPPELVSTNFMRPEIHMGKYNGIGEMHELRMRGDGQAELSEYNSYRGSHGLPSGHHNSGREYDVFPGAIRGGHQPLSHFEVSEAAPEGHQSVARFKGNEAMQGGRQSSIHYEGFESAQGRHQSLARFKGFEPEQGWHQSSARREGFEPTQDVLQDRDTTFSRAKQAVEFAEHIVRPTNRGNDIDMQRYDGYRDFQGGHIEFPQGARKRIRIDGGDDVQDQRVDGFFKTNMQETDTQVLEKESFHCTISSEREQRKQLLNYNSGDPSGAFGIEQINKGNSNKRQRVVSREEELLFEHGLLDDATDSKNDDTFESELLNDDKSLSQEGRHGFELTLPGRGNESNAMPRQSASEAKDFVQKFQLAKGEGSYNCNAFDRGYSHNSSHDTFNGSAFVEARNQSRDMPLHLHGSQRDLAQGQSVESGNFWHIKPNDMYSAPANEKFGSHDNRATFHVTGDGYHTPMQKSTEVSIEVDRVHQSDSRKIGRFEDHLVSEGSAIHKFSELRPKITRECQQVESLKTIEELHMDFVHQQQKKIHNQSHVQPPQFQEETSGSNKGRNVVSQAHQRRFQDFSQNQIEIQRQAAKISNLGQSAYNQVEHLPTTHRSESNTIQDQSEHDTRAGESVSKVYGDRMHQNNLRAHHSWSETLQPSSSQLDLSSKKNNYLSATVHSYDHFQHPPSHPIVQEHNLRLHEQQQRRHQSDQRSHDSEQQEGQLMPNQEPQNLSRGQQNQLNLQQHGLSQLPRQQFQQHIQSHDQHHFPSNQPITEKQNPSEWGYQLQQGGDQEAGQRYQFEVKDLNHHQFNQKMNTSIQNPPQFPQQPERHWHMNGHQQQPQVEHAELKSQYIFAARGPEISHANMHGSYDLRADGGGMPPVIQTPATMPKGQSLSQEPQVYTGCSPVPPLPPPPLPPSPPSSPSHAPPPPPPPPPASPPKSSVSANFSLDGTRTHSLPTSMRSFPDTKPSAHSYQYPPAPSHHGAGFASLGSQAVHQMPFKQFGDPAQQFPPKPTQDDRPKVVDAIHIFKQPGRINRPDRFVVILRGLPGSGKSYLAKALRDLEVTNGGSAPRIHSMDDYFMTEVEEDDDNDNGCVTSSLLRSKKRVAKKVMEYCYEPEMEEAYRASMLKAFKKTLEEGVFTFIIVDDRNLRVADFAQFWAVAKRSGYEVYLLDAPYKDPAGCAARNVHNFTADKVQEMAKSWEPAPSLYLQLDISALFHDDDLNAQNITEVEMDTDDTGHDLEDQDELTKTEPGKMDSPSEFSQQNVISPGDRWGLEKLNDRDEGMNLTRSKWSDNHEDGHNTKAKEVENVDSNALSGLMQAYGKGDRRVHWADQASSGFSIGRIPQNKCSLIIGPGEGYNEISNPLLDEEKDDVEYGSSTGGESKRNTKILEQLRAEQETFRAVFDRRRHRIAVVDEDDE